MTLQVASNLKTTNGSLDALKGSALNLLLNQRSPLPPTLHGAAKAYLQGLRDRATTELAPLTFPSTRDEEWRFTKLTPLLELDWSSTLSNAPVVSADSIRADRLPDVETYLVFVNGAYRADLSNVTTALGVTVGALSDEELFGAIAPTLDQYLAQQQGLEQTFTTLNTASFTDGAVIWIDAKTVAPSPIHILSISTASQTAPIINHPRCLVVAEPNSQVTLIEEYLTVGEAPYLTNPVTEIYVGDNAQVNHVRVQQDGTTAFHIGKTAVSQAPDSRYHCHAISLGGRISRHNLEIFQTGPQTETILNGLSMIGGKQLADTHSLIAY
ncbi:MAG: Fe-S cluster assembly protein SufD, partial [Symploca sp. SIO2B6]|nr:Fe-S cluster assembly protein SufD [Symploca sp. SIO2B6]